MRTFYLTSIGFLFGWTFISDLIGPGGVIAGTCLVAPVLLPPGTC